MEAICAIAFCRRSKSRFIHVLDRRRCDMVSHDIGEALEAPGTVLADPGDGRGHQLHPEEIGHQLDQTLLGQQLVVQEIEHKAPIRGPYCTGALTPSGNGARVSAPQAAHRQSCARCSVTTRGRGSGRSNTCRMLWPTLVSDPGPRRPKAGRRVMIDDLIGISDLPQRLAFVTLCPPGSCRNVPAGSYPCRLLQPIARRRLAAVRTVQPEPALKFGHPRSQRRIPAFSAAISAIRSSVDGTLGVSRIIRFLNSEPAVAVEEILFRLSLSPYLGCYQ